MRRGWPSWAVWRYVLYPTFIHTVLTVHTVCSVWRYIIYHTCSAYSV
jgi:hypothetical protein